MDKYIIELIKATDLFGKVNTKIASIPNPYILTYVLEAIDSISSNDIENIFTTVDEAYDNSIMEQDAPFYNYREALKQAHKNLISNELILVKDLKQINKRIRGVDGEFRKGPVSIKDSKNNILHKPMDAQQVPAKMTKLVELINQERTKNQLLNALDIHHKFEYIHPFSDGNGRTGRILFALLLAKYEILDIPASVFSYSIMKEKKQYYKALQFADKGQMNDYYEIMLSILNESLEMTLVFIQQVKKELDLQLNIDNEKKKKIIWQLFSGVKVSNKLIVKNTGFNNKTVSKYVDELIEDGLIEKNRKGKYVTYKNLSLERIIKKVFTELK